MDIKAKFFVLILKGPNVVLDARFGLKASYGEVF